MGYMYLYFFTFASPVLKIRGEGAIAFPHDFCGSAAYGSCPSLNTRSDPSTVQKIQDILQDI